MRNEKSGGDDGISAEMLKYLPPSGIREMTKMVLERIILNRLIKHREETTRDEQAGFRPGRSTIGQVFIVRRVIEIWQRNSKPMQLAFLDFEAVLDSPHRGRLLNALRADGAPGKFVRLLVVTGVRQGTVTGPLPFNLAIDDIMRRIVDQCPDDIVLAPSGCPLTDREYAEDVVIFAESSIKLQHVDSYNMSTRVSGRRRSRKSMLLRLIHIPIGGFKVPGLTNYLAACRCHVNTV
ncbi:hypothetical protein RB195_024539 [Necator americanus]|uniref:Reverse transcriptase domain-containing protein n=1 Tax=Necator americanus TaxID=51031 RepID=A0ABR1ENM0_NECAM